MGINRPHDAGRAARLVGRAFCDLRLALRGGTPEQHQRPGLHPHLAAAGDHRSVLMFVQQVLLFCCVESHRPLLAPFRFRQRELERLVVRVEHDVEAVVDDRLAALVRASGSRGR